MFSLSLSVQNFLPMSSLPLPPLILPGGGKFRAPVFVALQHQTPPAPGDLLRWRFSMTPSARSENGPSFEGRVPARPELPFEECYQFGGKMGFRRSLGPFQFEFATPGVYRVQAWVETAGGLESATQFSAFELVLEPPRDARGC